MNKDTIAGSWNVAKNRIRARFGKLTDEELDDIDGDFEQLCGRIQEAYGLSREQAEYDLARLS
jgi:uncharacterized protein YjbJ (UPF0337 family)